MNKLWRLAQTRLSRRALFTGAAAVVASGFAGKWLVDKFASPDAGTPQGGNLAPTGPSFVDARELKRTMSVEQLNATAEQYFARANNWDFFLAKPLNQIEDAPALLNNVAHLLKGLQMLPGMSVLDFGAGSCWLSRWLTQMGMEVIALDVSATALKIGQALYARLPIIGEKPPPRFLHFDGHRIELADASVDRILCLDVFHHLPNPDEVLAEMSRILKPGGIAGFSEPGPNHSRSPGAQFEMRYFKVLEDDVEIHRIWDSARQAGFTRLRLAVVSSQPFMLTLPDFEDYLSGGKPNERFAEITRSEMQERRMFFLQKSSQPPVSDSRSRAAWQRSCR
jgi:2-polyprenyl-3-methyl-5-hydroxy-6-metoxy-1,4-benzoquinol methylase